FTFADGERYEGSWVNGHQHGHGTYYFLNNNKYVGLLMASAMKKKVGWPRITLTVPSIVIMVPGMFMYKGIYYMGLNDVSTGALWLSKAVLIVTALPLGLICARILTDNNFRKSS
ncbi:MAG: threonine/serine exporter family protein, partial [Ruminococcus sp.]|nr:threonine/serine exporter family protein [Ruminococcus sp.]